MRGIFQRSSLLWYTEKRSLGMVPQDVVFGPLQGLLLKALNVRLDHGDGLGNVRIQGWSDGSGRPGFVPQGVGGGAGLVVHQG